MARPGRLAVVSNVGGLLGACALLLLAACGGGGGASAATVPGGGGGGGTPGGGGGGGTPGGGGGGTTPPPVYRPTLLAADLRIDTDAAGAAASIVPDVACDGNTVAVVWQDQRAGLPEVFYRTSLDGGVTWMLTDARLPRLPAGLVASTNPRVAVSGLAVYAVWQDNRNGAADVFFNRSLDGGMTWLVPDVRLDTDVAGAAASEAPRLALAGTNVYVVWQDARNGARDIYLNRSADAGTTWLAADVRLDTNAAGVAGSHEPRIAASGAYVYVTWFDQRNGLPDVYANASADSGATWLAADVRLDTDVAGSAISLRPAVACDGANAYVVWEDRRSGAGDVRCSRTTNGGATWSATDVRLDTDTAGAAASTVPVIQCTGTAVRVAWVDDRDGSTDIRFNRSADGGGSWLASDVRVDGGTAGAAASAGVVLAGNATDVFVVWSDDRDGATDVLLAGSVDGGATFTTDVRLDNGDVAGAFASSAPAIANTGRRIFVAWTDARAGGDDIHLNTSP
ncbi:MAG: exo-alpha-sialidase [Planctomycetia bacterium]|nr:exo-alpha-sialidase [Planctomycetia bacterium]